MSEKPIDVIFVTHLMSENRIKLFVQAINSFYKNTDFRLVNSVTLVDDCSPTEINIETPDVKYIRNSEQKGAGWSRNIAINSTHAPIIYLSDTDIYFTQGWLNKLYAAYLKATSPESKVKFGLLAGGAHKYSQTNERVYYPIGEILDLNNLIEIHTKDAVSTWSWMFSRDLYDKIGKIADNCIGGNASEDVDWCNRLHKTGYEVGSIWPEVVFHTGITSYDGKPSPGAEIFPKVPDHPEILFL